MFDIEAGTRDVLEVTFNEAPEGTIVNYAYGASFEQAIGGGAIDEVEGQSITIAFPNNLYFSIEHITDPSGSFEFDFRYTDNIPAESDGPQNIFQL